MAWQAPNSHLLAVEGSMFLHEPTPKSIPDIKVEGGEQVAGANSESEVISPASKIVLMSAHQT